MLVGTLTAAAMLLPGTTADAAGPPACRTDCVRAMTPLADVSPFGITAGPLGSEWFSLGGEIGRVDRQGTVHTYTVPTADPNVGWLTNAEGAIWFSERGSRKVGRIAPDGSIREYPMPGVGQQGIVLPGNGSVYVAEQFSGDIARLDPVTGHVTTYQAPDGRDPLGLSVGADGAIWFTERAVARIGRMTLDGQFRIWNLTPGSFPNRLTLGADGAIWFTELLAGKVGRITTGGDMTEYAVDGGPVGITAGKDGQLYVAMFFSGEVARIALDGQVTGRWTIPDAVTPLQVATGFGHDIWTTAGVVYRVQPYATGG
jgi:virginiamycin B lyase